MRLITPFDISSTLYIPATHSGLKDIILGSKYPELKSVVICFEDAILDKDIPMALCNLKDALSMQKQTKVDMPFVFIRPRSLEMAKEIMQGYGNLLDGVSGFAIPKFVLKDLNAWVDITESSHLLWMPILETLEVYDINQMIMLSNALKEMANEKVLAIRIGGNDLMSILGLRRGSSATLYDGPLGYVIKMLVCVFGSKGFKLTAPVCEVIDNTELLTKEIQLDIQHGLIGKTVIHPTQIPIVEAAYKVELNDYHEAVKIIDAEQAVFKSNGSMCEPATHRNWALNIIERAKKFGYKH